MLEISGLLLQAVGYSESLAVGEPSLKDPASHTALHPRTLWPLFSVVCSLFILTRWTLEDRQLCLRLLSGSPQAPDEIPAALGQCQAQASFRSPICLLSTHKAVLL